MTSVFELFSDIDPPLHPVSKNPSKVFPSLAGISDLHTQVDRRRRMVREYFFSGFGSKIIHIWRIFEGDIISRIQIIKSRVCGNYFRVEGFDKCINFCFIVLTVLWAHQYVLGPPRSLGAA